MLCIKLLLFYKVKVYHLNSWFFFASIKDINFSFFFSEIKIKYPRIVTAIISPIARIPTIAKYVCDSPPASSKTAAIVNEFKTTGTKVAINKCLQKETPMQLKKVAKVPKIMSKTPIFPGPNAFASKQPIVIPMV